MTENQELKIHPFERTLGPGPYRVVGFFDLGSLLAALQSGNVNSYNNGMATAPQVERGMGSCAHCGHAILNIYIIQCSNGKRFGVGSDCVFKVGMEAKEISKIERMERERTRVKRQQAKARKGDRARNELDELIKARHVELTAKPHPTPYMANQGHTLLDYAKWTLERSNDGGIVFALNRIKQGLGV